MSETTLQSYIIHLCYFLSLLITTLTLPLSVISKPSSSEKDILLMIKKQWGNPSPLQSWNATSSHCLWPGISCAGDQTVIGISLVNLNISGEIPSSICDLKNLTTLDLGINNLGGEFPTVLYNCTQLQTLNLTENLFVGRLPNDINSLSPSLQHLDLSYNNFTGDVPSSLEHLQGLITLHLEQNLFNGAFPSELANLVNLEELAMAYNNFSNMKLPPQFGKLKSIRFLWMTQCNLIGEIPESLGNLSALEQLDLAENKLEGGIPSGLFLLHKLKFLYLYANSLSGEIATSGEALNLVHIDLSENNLTGVIPEWFGSLTKLELLSLFSNQFYGMLPSSIGLIPMLRTLKLFNNKFSGPFPTELGRHSRLEAFEVPDNEFTGQLPENLCSGGVLRGLVAFNNKLNGSIPKSLIQCHSLEVIRLNKNYLSGEIPQGIWSLRNLSALKLNNNYITGMLPDRLAPKLTSVDISNNRFSGEIPSSMMQWDQLVEFVASNNHISGTIPLELTSLSKLNTLFLDGNRLSGELPSKIISWIHLNILKLSRNQLSGSIPSGLGSLPDLNYLDLSSNRLSGQIPPELGNLKLPSLNLSSNYLIGEIPYGYDNVAYQTSFLNTSLCSVSGVLDLPPCKILRKNAQKFPLKYLAMVIVLGFMAIAYLNWFLIFELRKRKHAQDLSSWKLTSFQKLHFTEEEILLGLTETSLIGFGGSGKVYKIPVKGKVNFVAAKRIWNKKMRNEKQFQAEVQVLGTVRHLNIVKLLCCLSNKDESILVYEYMENQSLDKWIHKGKWGPTSKVLDWPTRLKVAIGAARGLSYLHHDCKTPIIHRDVKSGNILLDSEFNAKIADFGLARILAQPKGEPYMASVVAGSFGYMAPECRYSRELNEKIDIYSFGVVLLELLTGKKPHKGDEYSNLAEWARKHHMEGYPIADALNEEVKDECCLEEMGFVFRLALACTGPDPELRPSMKDVLQFLLLLQQWNYTYSAEGPQGGGVDGTNYEHESALLGNGNGSTNSSKEIKEDPYRPYVIFSQLLPV